MSGAGALVLLLANTLRLGLADHLWTLAIVIDVLGVAAIPVVAGALGRKDRRRLAGEPGALFVAGASVLRSQLEEQSRFQPAVQNVHRSWIGGGFLGGELEVTSEGFRFRPGRLLGFGASDLFMSWGDVKSVDVVQAPAKINVGNLDVRLRDGSRLDLEVRGYGALRSLLADLQH